MNRDLSFYVKIVLAVLLVLCVFDMPYGYFQLVRTLSCFGFFYFGVKAYRNGSLLGSIVYAVLAVLFQPFAKIALGRELWIVVDLIVAGGLVYSAVKSKKIE